MDDILRTSISTATLDDARRRLDDAPEWARAAIDHERERRGMPTLFGRSAPPKVAAKARSLRPPRAIVGVAAPGISTPHHLDAVGVHELLPEIVSRSAWDGVKADLAAGKTFAFRTDHDGTPFLRSDDPAVSIDFDPVAGMLFTIRGVAASGYAWPGGGFASICFAPRRWEKRMLKGRGWVRVITAMTLDHIALLPPHHAAPAYRQARVLSVKPEEAMRAFVNLRVSTRLAVKELGL
jgi:hypothetical protein